MLYLIVTNSSKPAHIWSRRVKTGKVGGQAINSLAEIAGRRIDESIERVCGVTRKQWQAELRNNAKKLTAPGDFPISTIRKCAAVETAISGSSSDLLRYYTWLASCCLTTAFIMTQRSAALRRIETSQNELSKIKLTASIHSGSSFATVGISHLTTSRRHLSQPPLRAARSSEGWVLDGYSPWVTGGRFADWLVVGAVEVDCVPEGTTTTKSLELLFSIATNQTGVNVEPSSELMALNASSTGPVRFEHVAANHSNVLHGPTSNVMEASSRSTDSNSSNGTGSGAGGLHTSALAIGHAAQAIEYLTKESQMRGDLRAVAEGLQNQWRNAFEELDRVNCGESQQDLATLRKKANDLALKSTQAALAAAKGAGFANDHDVGRWCREAMFFLVWSCPQSVVQAHLCSFLS